MPETARAHQHVDVSLLTNPERLCMCIMVHAARSCHWAPSRHAAGSHTPVHNPERANMLIHAHVCTHH